MISVAVMAHRKREAFIPELLASLDRPAEVVWDEKDDRWDTGRRSMLAFDPEATHHLVLQDDAIVCQDLVAGLEKAVAHVPESSPLCLYVGTLRPYPQAVRRLVKSTTEDTSWVRMPHLNWGVGVVVPTPVIPEMIEWCDSRDIANYDKRMSAFFQHKGVLTWYPWPSLVDHRDSPSLVKGRTGGRRAHRFIGADSSAVAQVYSGGVLDIPLNTRLQPETAKWRNVRTRRSRDVRVGSAQERAMERDPDWEPVIPGHCPRCGQREVTDASRSPLAPAGHDSQPGDH